MPKPKFYSSNITGKLATWISNYSVFLGGNDDLMAIAMDIASSDPQSVSIMIFFFSAMILYSFSFILYFRKHDAIQQIPIRMRI